MQGFKSGFGLKIAGVVLGVGCRAVGEAGGGGKVGGRVGGGSLPDRYASASLILSSYLAIVVSAMLRYSDICLFRCSAII